MLVGIVLNVAECKKKHYIVEEPMEDEHLMVQSSVQAPTCQLCFFDDSKITAIPSENKFCLDMQGSQRVGFEWT